MTVKRLRDSNEIPGCSKIRDAPGFLCLFESLPAKK